MTSIYLSFRLSAVRTHDKFEREEKKSVVDDQLDHHRAISHFPWRTWDDICMKCLSEKRYVTRNLAWKGSALKMYRKRIKFEKQKKHFR